jgi:HNH endonuclease
MVKEQQLGMSFGKACHRLRRDLMFSLIQETGKDFCFRCGNKIENSSDFSMDHKEAWLHSENPKVVFFSIPNIAFSHKSCNTNARRVFRKYATPEESHRISNEKNAAYMRRRYSTNNRRLKKQITGY